MAATVTGSPVFVTTSGGTVTVPSDAQGVIAAGAYYNASAGAGLNTISLGGASSFTVPVDIGNGDGGLSANAQWAAYATISSTGSQTFSFSLDASATEGPVICLQFVKGIDTGDWIRDVQGDTAITSGTVTATVSSSTTDLVLGFNQKYSAVPGTASGWTSLGTTTNNSEGARLSSANSPGASTTTLTDPSPDYSSVAVFAIKSAATGSIALTGVSGTGSVGSVSPSTSKALTGNAGTAAVGSVVPTVSKALTGNSATGGIGSVSPSTQKALTGNAATGAVGTLTPTTSLLISGVSGTGGVGNVGVSISIPFTGVEATGQVGNVTAPGGQTITGVSGAGQVGNLSPAVDLPLTGISGTAAAGNVAPELAKGISGNFSTGAVGSVGVAVTVALTGVQATGEVGNIAISQDITLALTGVSAQGQVGNVTVGGAPEPALPDGGVGGEYRVRKNVRRAKPIKTPREEVAELLDGVLDELKGEKAPLPVEVKPAPVPPPPKVVVAARIPAPELLQIEEMGEEDEDEEVAQALLLYFY